MYTSSTSSSFNSWQLTPRPDRRETLSYVNSTESTVNEVADLSIEEGALLVQVLLRHPLIAQAFAQMPAEPTMFSPVEKTPMIQQLQEAQHRLGVDISRLDNPEAKAAFDAIHQQHQAHAAAPHTMPTREPPFTPEGMPTEPAIQQGSLAAQLEENQGSTLLLDLLKVAHNCPNRIFAQFTEASLNFSLAVKSSGFEPTPPRLTSYELRLLDNSFRAWPHVTAWLSSFLGVEFCWECRRRQTLCRCPSSSPEPTKQEPAEGAAAAPTSPETPPALKKAPPEAVLLYDFSEGYAGGKNEGFAKGEAAGYARAKAEMAEATCPGQFGSKGCTRDRNHHGMCVSRSGSEWTGPMMEHRLAMAYECGRQKERELALTRSAPPSSRELELATAALQITPSGALVLVPHQHFSHHLGFVPSPERLKYDRIDLAQWLQSLRHGLASVLAMAVKASSSPSAE